ncbi:hypothetical protein GCM10027343_09790 [Noviherbaspirillum agri]
MRIALHAQDTHPAEQVTVALPRMYVHKSVAVKLLIGSNVFHRPFLTRFTRKLLSPCCTAQSGMHIT